MVEQVKWTRREAQNGERLPPSALASRQMRSLPNYNGWASAGHRRFAAASRRTRLNSGTG